MQNHLVISLTLLASMVGCSSANDPYAKIKDPPLVDWMEGFVGMRMHALVRFGRWQAILDEPLPADPELYCVPTTMIHYAKGIAHAVLSQVP